MANNEKLTIFGVIIGLIVAYEIWQRAILATKFVGQVYDDAVDNTADLIADVTGMTKQEAELEKPINTASPEFVALTEVVRAYKDNQTVAEEIWQLAYDGFPVYGTVLRAGKRWGYGRFWQYMGKEF